MSTPIRWSRHLPASAAGLALAAALGCWAAQPAATPTTAPAAEASTRPIALAPLPPPGEFAPFVLVHGGDPELGSPDLPGTAGRLPLFARRANALGAELVILPGDLMHDPDHADQQQAFDQSLAVFKMPVRAVPGNHDTVPAEFRKRFGPAQTTFTFRDCQFVCVDSNHLSAASLAWLEQSLKDARAFGRTHIFVVIHHPPEGSKAMNDLFARYGVSAVLCGHTHTTGQAVHKGYTTYWTSGTAKVRDSSGLRYNVFRVYKDRIEQESVPLEKEVSKITLGAPASAPAATTAATVKP
jgi:3',5'-cyclic AMP phosphodiesterase CpdA